MQYEHKGPAFLAEQSKATDYYREGVGHLVNDKGEEVDHPIPKGFQ